MCVDQRQKIIIKSYLKMKCIRNEVKTGCPLGPPTGTMCRVMGGMNCADQCLHYDYMITMERAIPNSVVSTHNKIHNLKAIEIIL